jgi:hypothetical protein
VHGRSDRRGVDLRHCEMERVQDRVICFIVIWNWCMSVEVVYMHT